MTIASEITRLQGAKASIEASIENKGITVPDNAKIDIYSLYIDQISASATGLATGITTYPKVVHQENNLSPEVAGFVSWDSGNSLYGVSVCYFPYSSSDKYGIVAFRKDGTSDITYYASQASGTSAYSSIINVVGIYKQNNIVRAFYTTSSSAQAYNFVCFMSEWNISTNAVSTTFVGRYNSANPADWGYDLTGRTQITGSTWVQNVTAQNVNSKGCLYLTLKMNSSPTPGGVIGIMGSKTIRAGFVTSTYVNDLLSQPLSYKTGDYVFILSPFKTYTGSGGYDGVTSDFLVWGPSSTDYIETQDRQTFSSGARWLYFEGMKISESGDNVLCEVVYRREQSGQQTIYYHRYVTFSKSTNTWSTWSGETSTTGNERFTGLVNNQGLYSGTASDAGYAREMKYGIYTPTFNS